MAFYWHFNGILMAFGETAFVKKAYVIMAFCNMGFACMGCFTSIFGFGRIPF
jgi:hypothetical protein